MRLVLLFLILFIAVVEGRRGSKNHVLGMWGYPYGWGLDDTPTWEEIEKPIPKKEVDPNKEVKPVKRGRLPACAKMSMVTNEDSLLLLCRSLSQSIVSQHFLFHAWYTFISHQKAPSRLV